MLSLTVGATVAKGLFPVLGAAGTTLMRLGIATLLLFAIWRPWRAAISRKELGVIALYGGVLGAMNLTFFEAIARLPIGIAIALEFLGPLSVAFFLSKGRMDVMWATLALIGVVLLLPLSRAQASIDVVGVIFALIAASLWATYILVGKRVSTISHPGMVTATGMMVATLAVAPFGAQSVSHVTWTGSMATAVVAMALLSSAIPYSLEMAALKRLDSKTFGILLSLEPALGAITAFLFLRENLTLVQCLAIASVMTASIGSTVTSQRKARVIALE